MSKDTQKGFTLIELVVVILILGILAAFAIPRFISLQREARIAALDGVRTALRSGSTLVYARVAVAGDADIANANVDLDGDGTDDIVADYGYPEAQAADLTPLFDDLSPRFNFANGGAGLGSTVEIRFDGIDNCEVTYQSPTGAGDAPNIAVNNAAC